MVGEVEFDQIAPVYDETRRPPSAEELEALVGLLHGCRSVLDAGIGTGRFAKPLADRGFDIVGIDLSVAMMRRAREKGLRTLVRGNVLRLPFADRAVDAVFMTHVLQFIPEPRVALAELARVARRCVIVQLPEWFERPPSPEWRARQARYREIAAEMGYPLPERGRRYWHSLEELSEIAPPQEVRTVSGPPPSGPSADERFSRWAAEMVGGGRVPPEVHETIVRRLREEFPIQPSWADRPRTSRFVAWSASQLTTLSER